jgi:hypothetical protein
MLTKTIHQPLGLPVSGVASGTEIMVQGDFKAGDWLSVSHNGRCDVDRVIAATPGAITVAASYPNGPISLQRLADMSGFWLQLDTCPLDPVSLGVLCSNGTGMLLDRPVDPSVIGRTLEVNGVSFGKILGAAVMAGNRALLSVEKPGKVEGVAIATAGNPSTHKGPRSGSTPFVSISAPTPRSGSYTLTLNQGWQSAKACIPDAINYSQKLCCVTVSLDC